MDEEKENKGKQNEAGRADMCRSMWKYGEQGTQFQEACRQAGSHARFWMILFPNDLIHQRLVPQNMALSGSMEG